MYSMNYSRELSCIKVMFIKILSILSTSGDEQRWVFALT